MIFTVFRGTWGFFGIVSWPYSDLVCVWLRCVTPEIYMGLTRDASCSGQFARSYRQIYCSCVTPVGIHLPGVLWKCGLFVYNSDGSQRCLCNSSVVKWIKWRSLGRVTGSNLTFGGYFGGRRSLAVLPLVLAWYTTTLFSFSPLQVSGSWFPLPFPPV